MVAGERPPHSGRAGGYKERRSHPEVGSTLGNQSAASGCRAPAMNYALGINQRPPDRPAFQKEICCVTFTAIEGFTIAAVRLR